MTRARREQVSLDDTPYYHCVSRCVRRAFLCGEDAYSGRSYEHRKAWVVSRLNHLSESFCVDVCAYAVMSNHYHLVIHIDADKAKALSDDDVIQRWRCLYAGAPIVQRYVLGELLSEIERRQLQRVIDTYRDRLADLSWYMRCLNEFIARLANAEDHCTGRFWEGRYKCQTLLDEIAVVTAMAYVDLNSVRANLAKDLIESDHTSVQQRLFGIAQSSSKPSKKLKHTPTASVPLMNFAGIETIAQKAPAIPFNQQDYLELVDWTGRQLRPDKRGAIHSDTPTLIQTLGINPNEWLPTVAQLQDRFELVIGAPHRLEQLAMRNQRHFYRGIRAAKRLYQQANAFA